MSAPQSSPGCDDPSIQECVCAFDSFCCDNEWDQICVNEVPTGNGTPCGSCGSPATAPATPRELASRRDPHSAAPTAANLRDAFIAKLAAAGLAKENPGSELLVNLQTPDQANGHESFVTAYVQACAARLERDAPATIRDVLEVAALRRARMKDFSGVLEFPETMVTDDLSPGAGTHLDRATCELAVD